MFGVKGIGNRTVSEQRVLPGCSRWMVEVRVSGALKAEVFQPDARVYKTWA